MSSRRIFLGWSTAAAGAAAAVTVQPTRCAPAPQDVQITAHPDGHHELRLHAPTLSNKCTHPEAGSSESATEPRKRPRIQPTEKVDFIRLLPKDVLLLLVNEFLSDRSAGAVGRTAWTHLTSLKSYRLKGALGLNEMLRVVDATEHEAENQKAGRPTPPAHLHPHTHLALRDTPHEAVAAKQFGYPSMVAYRAPFAFGRPQTTHLILTRHDLSRRRHTEAEFLWHLHRLPPSLRTITLRGDVLDATPELHRREEELDRLFGMHMYWHPGMWANAPRPDQGHLEVLCRNWPPSVISIWFSENRAENGTTIDHAVLPLFDWNLPPGLTELRISRSGERGDPFYLLGDLSEIRLPSTLTRLDAGAKYDHDLNFFPRSDQPPARTVAEQAAARTRRLAAARWWTEEDEQRYRSRTDQAGASPAVSEPSPDEEEMGFDEYEYEWAVAEAEEQQGRNASMEEKDEDDGDVQMLVFEAEREDDLASDASAAAEEEAMRDRRRWARVQPEDDPADDESEANGRMEDDAMEEGLLEFGHE
jgi:hypothetical protein